jgi:hypothetical protein
MFTISFEAWVGKSDRSENLSAVTSKIKDFLFML